MKYPKWYIIHKISGPGNWQYKYVKRTCSKIWDLIMDGEEVGFFANSPKRFIDCFTRHNKDLYEIKIHSKINRKMFDCELDSQPLIFNFENMVEFKFKPIEELYEKENK